MTVLGLWEGGDEQEPTGDDICAAWSLRCLAVVCFLLGGSGGSALGGNASELSCPRAEGLAVFWLLVRSLGGAWLVFDVASCAFCLRITWLTPRVGKLARPFGAALWFLALYGLWNYGLQLKFRRCWGPATVVLALLLLSYILIGVLWLLLIDCDYVDVHDCTDCLRCRGGNMMGECGRLEEWPPFAADVFELDDLEPSPPAPGLRGSPVARAPGPEPATLGRPAAASAVASVASAAPAAAQGSSTKGPRQRNSRAEIRVLRGSKLLHVGRTRHGVKRWLRRHLQGDYRGVTVEDRTPGSSGTRCDGALAERSPRGASCKSVHGETPSLGSSRSNSVSPKRPKQVPPLDLSSIRSPV